MILLLTSGCADWLSIWFVHFTVSITESPTIPAFQLLVEACLEVFFDPPGSAHHPEEVYLDFPEICIYTRQRVLYGTLFHSGRD